MYRAVGGVLHIVVGYETTGFPVVPLDIDKNNFISGKVLKHLSLFCLCAD